MNAAARLTIVVGLGLLLATAALLLLPTSAATMGAGCGSVLNPAISDSDRREAARTLTDLDGTESPTLDPNSDDFGDLSAGIAVATVECDNALGSRWWWVIGTGAATIVAPLVIMFVGGARLAPRKPR